MKIVGFIEQCSNAFISGWCMDKHGQNPLRISVFYDGACIGQTITGHRRPDVGAIHGFEGVGFYLSFPPLTDKFDERLFSVVCENVQLPFLQGAVRREYTPGSNAGQYPYAAVLDRVNGQSNVDPELTRYKLSSLHAGLQMTELLTEIHLKCDEGIYFSFKKALEQHKAKAVVGSLSPWMYHFAFKDCKTSDYEHTYSQASERMHDLRSDMITQTIKQLYGSKIREMTVLDIGCNCGVFSFDLASIGAKHVVGIDVFERNIEQAKVLNSMCCFNNVEFHHANIKDIGKQKFDIILNLGVMYHLSNPLDVMELCYSITKSLCVIDTICHGDVFPGFFSTYKPRKDTGIEGDTVFELQPTYRGMLDLISLVGFDRVREVVSTSVSDMDLYRDGVRRCLFCTRGDNGLN